MFGKTCVILSFLLWMTVALGVGVAACFLVIDVYGHLDHDGPFSSEASEQCVAAIILTIFAAFFAVSGPIAGIFAGFFWRWSGRNKKKAPAGDEPQSAGV